MWKATRILFLALPTLAACSDYSNQPAAESIAKAVKVYEQQVGSYPAKLADLVPEYLPELPKPASQHFLIGYGAEPDLHQCWIVYAVHRDRYEEFDCNEGKWTNVEIEDSHLFRHPNVEYLRPEHH